ncbi:hypothetical protein D3C85_1663460 [compost metagenome]
MACCPQKWPTTTPSTTAPATMPKRALSSVETSAWTSPPPPTEAATCSIAACTGGMPWVRMAPPTMNMAAVPTTDRVFIRYGAAPTMRLPSQASACEDFWLRYRPRSSSLTMPATRP